MRVAYLVNQYPAVSHSFIRREIHAVERRGIEVARIALRGWDLPLIDPLDIEERERTDYLVRAGLARLLLALLRCAVTRPRRLARAAVLAWRMARRSASSPWRHAAYLAEAALLAKWLALRRVEHLHAHFATNPAEVAMLCRALGGPPYSFTGHGSDIVDRPAEIGLPFTVGHARFVVAVCAYGRSQMMRWVSEALWPRIAVARCGLDPSYGQDSPSVDPGCKRFVFVGRLTEVKGPTLLLQAARELMRRGADFELVLGGDGPLRAALESGIRQAGLTGRVRITGWLDATAVQGLLRDARCLVLSSLSEGLPVVAMEAMACGRPVIAPHVAGLPELVRPGENGWLYPAGDVDALTRAVESCLATSPTALERMGDAARQAVRAAHDINAEAAKLAAWFASPIDAPTSATAT